MQIWRRDNLLSPHNEEFCRLGEQCEICDRTTDHPNITQHRKWVNSTCIPTFADIFKFLFDRNLSQITTCHLVKLPLNFHPAYKTSLQKMLLLPSSQIASLGSFAPSKSQLIQEDNLNQFIFLPWSIFQYKTRGSIRTLYNIPSSQLPTWVEGTLHTSDPLLIWT